MDSCTKERVAKRAGGCCEYCRISGEFFFLPFQIEHIIPRKHHGGDDDANLALACDRCNQHKGANLAGIDQQTGELTRLFNPRIDQWEDHFIERSSGKIEAITAIGRVTVDVLHVNAEIRIVLRAEMDALRCEPNQ